MIAIIQASANEITEACIGNPTSNEVDWKMEFLYLLLNKN
ncbi:hypothetical protein B4080_5575 [Bacillus cereus]|nr:hypothetical protein B4080_5575 [Bacillus cereus]